MSRAAPQSDLSALNSSMDSLAVNQPAASASSSQAVPADIAVFNNKTDNLPGFDVQTGHNLKLNIRKKEKALGLTHDFENFELGRASVRPGDSSIAIGTDNPEAQQFFLSIIDGNVLRRSARDDPVACYLRVPEHLCDVKWLNSSTLLAATGKGNLKLFHFDAARKTLKHIGDMKDACTSYIREVAVQQSSPNNVAIGGFDQKLNFLDLNRPDNPYVQRLNMQSVIGNVKWAPFHNHSYVSCGLDEGKFYLFDARVKIQTAAFFLDTRKEDLFTHERYNEYNVMFGYGDGEIKHIDMRVANKILHTVQDPFVEAIGGIEWCQESEAFVVSGYTDFTLWKMKGNQATVVSHGENSSKRLQGSGYQCNAVFYDSKTVLRSDNAGAVELFIQNFE